MSHPLPLAGVRIIELAGIGPAPFCGMMLADNGAEVIRIDRADGNLAGVSVDGERDVLLRSRRSLSVNLKSEAGVEIVRRLTATADGLIEGFRPGVTERLGLGPDVLHAINPKLVYGRMTGWGQTGPYAKLPGHDINYIALSGILGAIGPKDAPPVAPLNLVGDYGGGGLMLAFAMVSAILAARGGGPGRVIDCAMAEGASALSAGIWTLMGQNLWSEKRGTNLLDGGAPFYASYETSDKRYVALGAIEGKFFHTARALLGFAEDPDFADQSDTRKWPVMQAKLQACFATQPQAHWVEIFEGKEACFSPVMSLYEAPEALHNKARENFIEIDGVRQPAPVPRYSNTQSPSPHMWRNNRDKDGLLAELGLSDQEISAFTTAGAFG